MGEVIQFAPRLPAVPEERGCIHVWAYPDGTFEIGQESHSGDSWGFFETFPTATEAVCAAYRLRRFIRETCHQHCALHIPESIWAAAEREVL